MTINSGLDDQRRGFGRRKFLTGASVAAAASIVGINPAGAIDNRIVEENKHDGSDAWRLTNPNEDHLEQLGAYARQTSVEVGDTLEICVLVPSSMVVTAQVFRLGWYGGKRARLMQTLTGSANGSFPLTTDPVSGETDSRQPPSFSITIPDNWVSGIYLVRVESNTGFDTHVTFAVRDSRPADIVFSQPVLTYAAYNTTPNPVGKSLYDFHSGGDLTERETQRATVSSLDRPYRKSGSADLFYWDHDLVSWLEREGYDVTYVTNIDIHRSGDTLQRGRINVVSGHDEYWSQEIMDAYLAARDAGVHIANLGANNAYWRVRLAASRDGRPLRRVVCFKYAEGEVNDTPTVLFRDTDTTMQGMWGIDFMDFFSDTETGPYAEIAPLNDDHWFWEGTGAENDQPLPGARIMGYEVDRRDFEKPIPDNTEYTFLSATPFEGDTFGRNWCHSVIYRAPSGAWVFSGGTTSWAWGLIRDSFQHPAIERATKNLFARMLADSDKPEPPLNPVPPGTINNATSIAAMLAATDYTEADAEILRLYRAFFGREPDINGAKYWLNEARAGRTVDDMGRFFATSDEFNAKYGPLNDAQFMRVVYQNILDREPDQEGFDFWISEMNGTPPMERHRVVLLFAFSPEFIDKFPYAPRS